MTQRTSPAPNPALPAWLITAIFLVIVVVSWWQTSAPVPAPADAPEARSPARQRTSPILEPGDPRQPIAVPTTPESDEEQATAPTIRSSPVPPTNSNPTAGKSDLRKARFEHQTIRNQDGEVVYRGTVDLQSTLDRIKRGDRNNHRNDGTVFQNRERRLPAKPSGHYREYVHPTPGLSGPGPQRVVLGKDGEAWYTPDHYQTFLRIQ